MDTYMDFQKRNKRITASKTSRRLAATSRKTMEGISSNWRLLLLLFLFTAGMVAGASYLRSGQETENSYAPKILELLENYRTARATQSMLATFSNSMLSSALLLLLSYTCGLCAIGMPVICSIPIVKGIGTGLISGYFYSQFTLKGLGYSLLLVCPGALLSTFGILLCCNESLLQTKTMYAIAAKGDIPNDYSGIRPFSLRFFILLLICAGGATLDAVLNRAFVGFFIF